MKSIFKPPLVFGINVLFIFLSIQSPAQPRGMTMNQVYSQLNKQDMNMRLQRQMQTGNMNWKQNVDRGKSYYVTFKDSIRKLIVSYMYHDSAQQKAFLVFVDKKFPKSDSIHRFRKIYPDQTLNISAITDEDAKTEVYGVPTDSCWAFKVINGSISVYAKSPDYLTLSDNLNENEFDIPEIIGIQLNDGPIVKLTDDNLKQMVGQDTNALESLEKKKYYKAVKKYNRHAKKATQK